MIKVGYGRGRKPIHIQGKNTGGYAAVWAAVRDLKVFTYKDIATWLVRQNISGANHGTIESYIQRLLKGEFISIKSQEHYRGRTYLRTYEFINDIGIKAPRLDKDGKKSTQGVKQENLWRSMKILKVFSYRELAASSSTSEVKISPNTAHTFINALTKAGYLVKIQKHRNTGIPARFRFLPSKDTGPLPPQIQRSKAVFDPNLNQVVWSPEDQVEKETQHA
jgi:hypothetical protein